MANLDGLIRLRRFELDERRRGLADFNRVAEELDAERARLERSIETEKRDAAAAGDPASNMTLGSFLQAALERRKRLDTSRDEIEAKIAEATEQVREAFSDLKALEEAEAQRRLRDAQKRARFERNQLDEIGIEGFRRSAVAR